MGMVVVLADLNPHANPEMEQNVDLTPGLTRQFARGMNIGHLNEQRLQRLCHS